MTEIDPTGLLPWQPEAARVILAALRKHGAAVDGSDLGTGKTFVAGAVIRAMGLPTLVIGRKISKTGWHLMGEKLGVEFDYINFEKLRRGNTVYGKWVDGKFEFCPEVHFVVFDEVHECSGLDSLNSKLLIGAKNQRIYTLALSATLGDSPTSFKALGYLLGLHGLVPRRKGIRTQVQGFQGWARSNGCGQSFFGSGLVFQGDDASRRAVMANIHSKLFPERGYRVRIEDLGDLFPDNQIFAELYDLQEKDRINQLWREMSEAMVELRDRKALDRSPDHPFVKLLRARQELELLKVPIFEQLARDDLAQGYSVVLFVNFRQTLEILIERLNIKCRIDGSQVGQRGEQERTEGIAKFQCNEERIIAANIKAGNISVNLQDLHGGFPRSGIVSPTNSARDFRQLFGRLRRAGGKSKALYRIPFAAGTVEVKMHRAVSSKLNCLDALQDSDLFADNLALTIGDADAIFKDVASAIERNEQDAIHKS